VAVLFGLPGGKKSVKKISEKFRDVNMMFTIAFYIENPLMASLPRAENAKHATGATDWEVRKMLEHSHIQPLIYRANGEPTQCLLIPWLNVSIEQEPGELCNNKAIRK
jgi:hypothetical protein